MFRALSRPSSGTQWLQWQPLVLPSYRGDNRTVFVIGQAGRLARPRTQHGYHRHTKVKPEAATAVIELLMMGGRTPETCWAVNKRQDNKLENCCIWLVIYLNCTIMHGLTNLKFKNGIRYLVQEGKKACYSVEKLSPDRSQTIVCSRFTPTS
jgi:hypothetical protein